MIEYLDCKIKSFENGLNDYKNYLCISRKFNEYGNQTIYDTIEIIYNDRSYEYYYRIYNIEQTIIILHAFILSRRKKHVNMMIKIIEYYICNLDYSTVDIKKIIGILSVFRLLRKEKYINIIIKIIEYYIYNLDYSTIDIGHCILCVNSNSNFLDYTNLEKKVIRLRLCNDCKFLL